MQRVTIRVGPDGRAEIPGTRAGQLVTIHVEPEYSEPSEAPERSPEEIERIIQRLLAGGQRVRERADPEWLNLDHGEWLYGEDGLPR
jgi:hypothetical protein